MTKSIPLIAIFASLFFVAVPACQSENDDNSDEDEDISCADSDTPDGTWVDPESCWMWQIENSPRRRDFDSANAYCESLKLSGFDDWRMPSITEMRSLIRGCPMTETGGECPLTDECQEWSECKDESCRGCEEGEGPMDGCYGLSELPNLCESFWWTANQDICVWFDIGAIVLCDTGSNETGMSWLVRCVRGG